MAFQTYPGSQTRYASETVSVLTRIELQRHVYRGGQAVQRLRGIRDLSYNPEKEHVNTWSDEDEAIAYDHEDRYDIPFFGVLS